MKRLLHFLNCINTKEAATVIKSARSTNINNDWRPNSQLYLINTRKVEKSYDNNICLKVVHNYMSLVKTVLI